MAEENDNVQLDIDTFLANRGEEKGDTTPDADNDEHGEETQEDEDAEESTSENDGEDEEGDGEETLADGLSPRERALLARIQELEATRGQEGPPSFPPLEITTTDVDFLSGVSDIDDLLGDREKLNTLLNRVHNEAKKEATKLAVEHVLKHSPEVLNYYAKKQVELYGTIAKFYAENKDLDNPAAKSYMGSVAAKIAEEEPGIAIEALFTKSAARVRKLLGIKQQEQIKKEKKSKTTNPGFVTQRSGANRNKTTKLTPLEEEMYALIPK